MAAADLNAEVIREIATQLRISILAVPAHLRPIQYQEFPRGACGSTSRLLATCLTRANFENVAFRSGKFGRYSHAWVQIQDVIVDVTADQKPFHQESVIAQEGHAFYVKFLPHAGFLSEPDTEELNFLQLLLNSSEPLRSLVER